MSQLNSKNNLLDKVAKFKGAKSQPRFDVLELAGPCFMATVTVTLTWKNECKTWTEVTTKTHTTKLGAQFAAAELMLCNPDFLHHLHESNWSEGQSRPYQTRDVDVLHYQVGQKRGSLDEPSTINKFARRSLVNNNQHDQKGWLIEKLRELVPPRSPHFATSTSAPFSSTVSINLHTRTALQ